MHISHLHGALVVEWLPIDAAHAELSFKVFAYRVRLIDETEPDAQPLTKQYEVEEHMSSQVQDEPDGHRATPHHTRFEQLTPGHRYNVAIRALTVTQFARGEVVAVESDWCALSHDIHVVSRIR